VQYLDVALRAGKTFTQAVSYDLQGFLYVFEGDAVMAGTVVPTHSFVLLGEGDTVEITAGTQGARFILVAGRPIKEPIVQYGPFVMNTREEIEQAFVDYRDGRLVRDKASFVSA
jgi:redox-sensitive bicupin YhaK (pirin superfamily)